MIDPHLVQVPNCSNKLTRREFLELLLGSVVLASCAPLIQFIQPSQPPTPAKTVVQGSSTPPSTSTPEMPKSTTTPEVTPTDTYAGPWIENGRIYEMRDGIKVQAEYRGVLPEQIVLDRIDNSIIQLNKDGKTVGNMSVAYDSKGRMMLVKPFGKSWIVAPFGSALEKGIWSVYQDEGHGKVKELGVVDAQGVMADTNKLRSIAEIVTAELANTPESGTVYPFADVVSYDMITAPGQEHQIYIDILNAFASTTANRQFWYEVGFNGTTGAELENWLKNSVGGPEDKPYWLPATSPKGTEFKSIVSNGQIGGKVDTWNKLQSTGGVYLDNIPFSFISPSLYQNNVWARAYAEIIRRDNENNPHPYIYISGISAGSIGALYGLLINKSHIEYSVIDTMDFLYGPNSAFGDANGNKRPEVDPKVATAKLQVLYLVISKKNNGYWACISPDINCGNQPGSINIDSKIIPQFVFK